MRPRVTKEMDGQWLFSWLFDCAAVSQAAFSTGGDVLAARRTAGWKGWMMGGKVWINEGRLVTDGATPVDGCFNSASHSTSRLCYLSGRRRGTPRLNCPYHSSPCLLVLVFFPVAKALFFSPDVTSKTAPNVI